MTKRTATMPDLRWPTLLAFLRADLLRYETAQEAQDRDAARLALLDVQRTLARLLMDLAKGA